MEDATMKIKPGFEERPEQHYAGIRRHIAREELAEVVPQALAELREALSAAEIEPSGPPLVRYWVVDYNMSNVEVDIGLPIVPANLPDHGAARPGTLPAGTYASVMHSGDYSGLVETTAALLDWAKRNGVAWNVRDDHNVTHWAGRVERYLVSPPLETDPSQWRTEISILVRD
ncbi:MAG: GyrI-like domain-containing protein [Acidobacteriota bacterium]